MTHLDEHPHAFVIDGLVVNVAIFAEHNEPLIAEVAATYGNAIAVCCCNVGVMPSVDWAWDGSQFIEPTE